LTRELLKSRIYPVVIGLSGLGVLLLLLSRFSIMAWIETTPSSSNPPTDTEALPAPSDDNIPPAPEVTAPPSSDVVPEPLDPVVANEIVITPENYRGQLRVSNQTLHPVRVALLSQAEAIENESESEVVFSSYREPAHWDFAPQEGSERGLLLSLPDSNLDLQVGDVVIAFAQDGSRRYWGPYVVGKTEFPSWDQETSEWLLIMRP
jgi:hypothetical protein